MNLRWTRAVGAALAALTLLGSACHREEQKKPAAVKIDPNSPEGSAQLLGRELSDIVDRVMAYRSAHRGTLPASLRQAGVDSLTPVFSREYSRQGRDPVVTIRFRHPGSHPVTACRGSNMVLEDAMLHEGRFEVSCELASGGSRTFTILPPAPPAKPE